MSDTKAKEGVELLRRNLIHSATPNMRLAIDNKAPIAALIYGLALIDTMAGFFYGVEAKKQAKQGDGVGIRYEKFIEEYLSPGHSKCNYSELDLYKSLRCNMAHSLTPGHRQKGKYDFYLVEDAADKHGSKKTNRTIIFDVPTFCNDVLQAIDRFLNDVEQSIAENPTSLLLDNFKGWWDKGYSILVSD